MIEDYIAKNFGNVHLRGFKYLVMVCKLIDNNEKLSTMCAYRVVASKYDVPLNRVERDIRHFIKKVSNYYIFKDVYCEEMTNTIFIKTLLYIFHKENKREGKE